MDQTSYSPIVSIVVITYNQEKTVGQTIDSILSQNHNFSFEIIVGEDCSSDGTRKICEQYATHYPETIKLMPKTANKGVVRNYGDCVKASKGKYVAICAGDDWWSNPYKVKMQVDFMESNPDYGVVHTDMDIFYNETGELQPASGNRRPPEGWVHNALYKVSFVNAPTAMIRRELMHFVDFDKFASLGFKMEDYPMWLELSRHTQFHFINQATVTYRVFSTSLSHSQTIDARIKFLDATKHIQDYFYSLYEPELDVSLGSMQNRMYYMECLSYGAYKLSFAYAKNMGFGKPLTAILQTYIGAWICGKVLKSKYYKKRKGLQ